MTFSIQHVDYKKYNALGSSATFRVDDFAPYNPTNASPPFFQVFDPSFVTNVLGPNAVIHRIAYDPGFAFAHEAPVYVSKSDELVFASNGGGALGFSDWDHNNQVGRISLKDAEAALEGKMAGEAVNVTVTKVCAKCQWLASLVDEHVYLNSSACRKKTK